MNQRGFTFVEVTLAIVVMAIALPSLLLWIARLNTGSDASFVLPTATFLASEMMEEIKSRKFDERDSKVSGNWSTVMGLDAGESGANKATFDDVDDFHGWAQNFGVNYPGYTTSVSVGYVAANDLNNLLTIPQPTPNNWTPSYKRVVITVAHARLAAPIQVATVVTEVQSL